MLFDRLPRAAPLVAVLLLIPCTGFAQQHFTDCVENDADDGIVVIPSDTVVTYPDGGHLRTGDEMAVYTEDGRCAGVAVWDSSETAMSVSVADVDSTAGVLDGYEPNEPLEYRIWRSSDEQEYEVSSSSYHCTLPLCRSDGVYRRDGIHEVLTLEASLDRRFQLATLNATQTPTGVILKWQTPSETDNAGFKVQHRSDSTETWSTLSFVEGAGTTTTPQSYRYEANGLEYGEHQFRLSQIDVDGTSTSSRTLEVTHSLTSDHAISKVYPNPVRQAGTLELAVKEGQHVVVRLYDVLGRLQGTLLERQIPPDQTETIQLDLDRVASGQYFLRIEGSDFRVTRRVTVVQ